MVDVLRNNRHLARAAYAFSVYTVWGLLLLLPSLAARAQDGSAWQVADADLRFNVRIASQPSDPRAGIVATFPDGGLLPRPVPDATVVDRAGTVLASECVWHNPAEGFGLVFERPSVGLNVWVYMKSGNQLKVHGPDSAFRPSLMVYVQPVAPGAASLEGAKRLAAEQPPGRNARFGMVDAVRSRNNPLWRQDQHFVTYYHGWLKPRRPGPTWIATVSQDGSQFLVDGRVVSTWPAGTRREAGGKGEFGGTVNLGNDIHRLEYLHYQRTGPVETLLAWRSPGAKSDDLPDEIMKGGFIHSGSGSVIGVESRTGAPVPLIAVERLSHLWLHEAPIYLVRCSVPGAPPTSDDIRYTWRIGDSPDITERDFPWLVEGNRERIVSLSVTSPQGAANATLPFYLRANTRSASVNNADHRQQYRIAFLNMCRLLPAGQSPAAQWSASLWNTLLDVLEPYKGRDLLMELFDRSRNEIRQMPAAIRHRLEAYFFEVIRYTDREATVRWLKRFHDEDDDRSRRLHWQMANVDFLLYDLNDTNAARRIVQTLQTASGDPAMAIRATIRMGDIERLAGNFDEASRLYSRAQDRSATLRRSQRTRQTVETATTMQRGADAIRAARDARQATSLRDRRAASFRVDDWRVMAVRGSVHYETVRNLIRTGFLFEARDAMAEWELEFPLHKMGEDLLIAEAEYFMTIGNYRRASLLLSNYRAAVSMTNFLPMAMQMELECLLQLQRDDDVRELAAEIEERLPNHPVAAKARTILATLGAE